MYNNLLCLHLIKLRVRHTSFMLVETMIKNIIEISRLIIKHVNNEIKTF